MTKISPWFLLLGALVGLTTFFVRDPAGAAPLIESLAFPAFVVAIVALDHVMLPAMTCSDRQKACVKAVAVPVLTILLVVIVRPSVGVAGIIVLVALTEAWSLYSKFVRR